VQAGRVFASVLGLAVLAGAAIAPACSADPPARIAFSADDAIYAMSADGSARVRLTEGGRREDGSKVVDRKPAWSPDGATIAFERVFVEGFRERSQVWAMRADGSDRHALVPDPGNGVEDHSPTFAPNGQVVFARDRYYATSRLIAVDPDGAHRHILVKNTAGQVRDLAFSPDGERILFTVTSVDADNNYQPHLWVMNADGSDRHLLAEDAAAGKWSPDGQRIAFVSVASHRGRTCEGYYYATCYWHGEIATMDADGGNPVTLTYTNADDQRPSWSADGTRIAFHSNRNFPDAEVPEIYSIGADGSCLTWLTNGSALSTDPTWAPTGGDPAPGRCGEGGREPTVDLDLSRAKRAKGFPVYWLGPTTANGMIASSVTTAAKTYFGLIYDDCGRFNPRKCGEAVGVDSDSTCATGPAATTTELLEDGVPSHLSVRRGVLVGDPGAHRSDPQLYAGRTTISLYLVSVNAALDGLRRLGRPATGLPRTALPDWFWKALGRVERSYERTHDVATTAKRLHLSRSAVKRRLALAKRLHQLGVTAHLACPKT
jgi:Tol biopolymer transport system component